MYVTTIGVSEGDGGIERCKSDWVVDNGCWICRAVFFPLIHLPNNFLFMIMLLNDRPYPFIYTVSTPPTLIVSKRIFLVYSTKTNGVPWSETGSLPMMGLLCCYTRKRILCYLKGMWNSRSPVTSTTYHHLGWVFCWLLYCSSTGRLPHCWGRLISLHQWFVTWD